MVATESGAEQPGDLGRASEIVTGSVGVPTTSTDSLGNRASRQFDDHGRGTPVGLVGEVGVDATLESGRRLGAETVPAGHVHDRRRVPRGGLHQDIGVVPARPRTARPPMVPDIEVGPLVVIDDQVLAGQRPGLPVEGLQLLTVNRPLHHEVAADDRVGVEGMQRMAQLQHHVVGDVDHIRDRPHPGLGQPVTHPERRPAHRQPTDLTGGESPAPDARLRSRPGPDRPGNGGQDSLRDPVIRSRDRRARSRAMPSMDMASGRLGVISSSNTTSGSSTRSEKSTAELRFPVENQDPGVVVAQGPAPARSKSSRWNRLPGSFAARSRSHRGAPLRDGQRQHRRPSEKFQAPQMICSGPAPTSTWQTRILSASG